MENTEKLVGRIRWFMNLDLSLDEIVAKLTDEGIPSDEIFLAYHAAEILEKDLES